MNLRDYQQRGLDEIRQRLRAGARSVLWQMPTGAGKTASTSYMLGSAASKSRRSWFVVHRRELILQSVRAFTAAGVPHGVVAAGFTESTRREVQICSVQTLARRLERMQAPDLIVWDECHHLAAGSWSSIYRRYPRATHIGLSATPARLDGKGLGEHFDAMVRGPTVRELIDGGYLVPYRAFAPATPDLSKVHTRMGDYVKSEVADLMDRPVLVGNAVDHYSRLARGKRAVVFAISIEASRHVVEAFRSAGIPAEHVDGETPTEARDAAIARFQSGRTLILSNVDLFGEGFDLPAIEAVILLRPTQSLSLYLQQVGRALRPSPGKTEAIILDHAGNILRHGLPDEEREWGLDGERASKRSREDAGPAIRQCLQCYGISRATSLVCQQCGCPFPVKTREVEQVAGELTEIDPLQARRIAKREQALATSLEALIELGRARGYKRPQLWAAHVWQSRQRRA